MTLLVPLFSEAGESFASLEIFLGSEGLATHL